MTTTVDKLAALPTLAARTTNANSDPGSHVPVKTQPGSKPPPGVNLDAIDNHQGRNHPALLRQLTRCIHMCQSRMTSTEWRQSPDLDPAPTWTTETRWLITTAPWWVGNQDARDLIITISDDLTSRLTSLWEATVDYKICGACGTPTQERQSDNLALCECPACERVLWMKARITTKQAAAALGITARGVRQQIARGKLDRDPDGRITLDHARTKLATILDTNRTAC